MSAKRELARFRGPDEARAQQRAWDVVQSAYRDRARVPQRRSRRRPAVALVAAALVGAVALSPAGATVGRLIGRALGIEHAAPKLFSLPTAGRLLVSGPGGVSTLAADGSIRSLGRWSQASWSPHGRYVAVVGSGQLAALDTRGRVQWSLARPAIRDPRWFAPSGYRVAYLSGGELRVLAGDGSGDHRVANGVARVAPAWRVGHPYQLAYVTRGGRLVVRDADSGVVAWSVNPGARVDHLAWSADGQRLLVLSVRAVQVFSGSGALLYRSSTAPGTPVVDGALAPNGSDVALVLGGSAAEVVVERVSAHDVAPRRVLSGVGLKQVEWSPDGRWLLVSWPAANQWVFVRVLGAPRIAAVSRIAQQLSGRLRRAFPQLDGWCCVSQGPAG